MEFSSTKETHVFSGNGPFAGQEYTVTLAISGPCIVCERQMKYKRSEWFNLPPWVARRWRRFSQVPWPHDEDQARRQFSHNRRVQVLRKLRFGGRDGKDGLPPIEILNAIVCAECQAEFSRLRQVARDEARREMVMPFEEWLHLTLRR
jgi:hypothetical protein